MAAQYEREPWRGYGSGPPHVFGEMRHGRRWEGRCPRASTLNRGFAVSGRRRAFSLSAAVGEQKTALDAAPRDLEDSDTAAFAERTAVSFENLSYNPVDTEDLDLI